MKGEKRGGEGAVEDVPLKIRTNTRTKRKLPMRLKTSQPILKYIFISMTRPKECKEVIKFIKIWFWYSKIPSDAIKGIPQISIPFKSGISLKPIPP